MLSQEYLLTLGVLFGINTIASLGLYFVIMLGQLSLGHGVMMSFGAYASALLMIHFGLPFWLTLPLAGVAGALGGWLYAYLLAVRLKGMYLSIATTALSAAIRILYFNIPLFGGALGVYGIPIKTTWWIVAIILVVLIVLLARFETSRIGFSFRAMKGDIVAAGAMGIDIRRTIYTAWVISGVFAGVAGGLYASFIGVIGSQDFGFARSVLVVLPPYIGGVGTLWGTILGSAIVVFVPEFLRIQASDRLLLYGIILVLIMLLRPKGILGDLHFSIKLPRWRRAARGEGDMSR